MYKKILTVMATIALLTACSEQEAATNNPETVESKETPVVQQENEQVEDYGQKDAKENEEQSKWTSLPEYQVIINQLGTDDVRFEMVSDYEGKRVLKILNENGSMLYKSIFIKDTKRLKIIDVNKGGIIYNSTL